MSIGSDDPATQTPSPGEDTALLPTGPEPEDRVSVASNAKLVWWRFRRNKLAVASAVILCLFYVVVLFPDFFATQDPEATDALSVFMPIRGISLFTNGRLQASAQALSGVRNPTTLRMEWDNDGERRILVRFFVHGYRYKALGFIPSDIHLLGTRRATPAETAKGMTQGAVHLLGTDRLGRDQWSRLMRGTRTSMTVGLLSVLLSVLLGVLLGGISGYIGGWTDLFIQRVIELLQSLPTIPIWLLMTAALPQDWRPERVFFAITLILAFIGWTTLGREVRGRFLSLREEDFVLAAELAGCSRLRIIARHMVPAFTSHIIAAGTLAIPVMIISETSLSFLGLGIRPPAISWGVLLQEAQNIQTLALAPWLLIPGAVVILAVLAFNLAGDGLRDAADPYAH